jgi:hypothetical protein
MKGPPFSLVGKREEGGGGAFIGLALPRQGYC